MARGNGMSNAAMALIAYRAERRRCWAHPKSSTQAAARTLSVRRGERVAREDHHVKVHCTFAREGSSSSRRLSSNGTGTWTASTLFTTPRASPTFTSRESVSDRCRPRALRVSRSDRARDFYILREHQTTTGDRAFRLWRARTDRQSARLRALQPFGRSQPADVDPVCRQQLQLGFVLWDRASTTR